MSDWLKKNKFLVSVLLLTFLLRLPSLFEPYWYGDEGIYLTLGLGIRKGLLLYKDIYDNKPPLIYLLAAISRNLFWFRFILLLACLGSVILISKLAKIFFAGNETAQKITVITFSLFSSIPLIEGNIANAEIFQICPILGAVYLLTKSKRTPRKDYFFAGLLFSVATLFKIPAIFDLAAITIFLFFFSNPKKVFSFEKRIFFLILGFIVPFLAVFSFFLLNHYLKEFIQIVFSQNLGYLSSWKTGSHQISLFKSGLFQKLFFLVLYLTTVYIFKRKFISKWTIFIQIWFLFSLFASLLSNRPYAHYLIQLLPSFSLLTGLIVVSRSFVRLLSVSLICLLLITSLKVKFWVYPVFSYYKNFLQFSLGQKSQIDYFVYFDKKVPQTYQIAFYLKNSTRPTDKIFIWGDEPYIFPLSKRLPASRFTAAYHIIDFNKFQEAEKELKAEMPKIIIFDNNKKGLFSNLEKLILINYSKVWSVENLQVFRLKNKNED